MRQILWIPLLCTAAVLGIIAFDALKPAQGANVAPICPAGFLYKAGTALCESSKPPACRSSDARIPDSCYAYSAARDRCEANTSKSKSNICSGAVGTGQLVCPAGHTLRKAQDDCYASQPARCPSGYTLKAALSQCVVGKAQ